MWHITLYHTTTNLHIEYWILSSSFTTSSQFIPCLSRCHNNLFSMKYARSCPLPTTHQKQTKISSAESNTPPCFPSSLHLHYTKVAFTDFKERKHSQSHLHCCHLVHSFTLPQLSAIDEQQTKCKNALGTFWNFSSSKTINPKTFHTPWSYQEFVELLSCHTSWVPINFPEATTLKSHDIHLQLAKNVHSILIQVLQ